MNHYIKPTHHSDFAEGMQKYQNKKRGKAS